MRDRPHRSSVICATLRNGSTDRARMAPWKSCAAPFARRPQERFKAVVAPSVLSSATRPGWHSRSAAKLADADWLGHHPGLITNGTRTNLLLPQLTSAIRAMVGSWSPIPTPREYITCPIASPWRATPVAGLPYRARAPAPLLDHAQAATISTTRRPSSCCVQTGTSPCAAVCRGVRVRRLLRWTDAIGPLDSSGCGGRRWYRSQSTEEPPTGGNCSLELQRRHGSAPRREQGARRL
jgi:hypothetical protein